MQMRQVLRFDLETTEPFTTIPLEDERYYDPITVGMFSDDDGWTERPAIWVIDRNRTEYDPSDNEMRFLSIPTDFQVVGSAAKFLDDTDDARYVGTVSNSDKSFIRHVFNATEA